MKIVGAKIASRITQPSDLAAPVIFTNRRSQGRRFYMYLPCPYRLDMARSITGGSPRFRMMRLIAKLPIDKI